MAFSPTAIIWVLVVNCTCPNFDTDCHRPSLYTSPIICVHRRVGNITEFLARGLSDNLTILSPPDGANSTNILSPENRHIILGLGLNILLTAFVLFLTILRCIRGHSANPRTGGYRLLAPRPPGNLGTSATGPNPLTSSIPRSALTLPIAVRSHLKKCSECRQKMDKLERPRHGSVANTIDQFEHASSSTRL